jgi:hypothetical protein
MRPVVRFARQPVLAVALVLLIVPLIVVGQESPPEPGHVRVRARVEPEVVYVGQKVELVIDVLTKTWFLGAPRFPQNLEVADAIVLPPEGFGVNFTERIQGETYAAQSRKLTLFATRPGVYEIPPATVRVVVADDRARPTPELSLETPPLRFAARLPEAAGGLGLVIATPRLAARQEWSGELGEARTGDALERTITLTVEDSAAMLLPPIHFDVPAGVAAYPQRPQVSDRRGRGAMTGTRVDAVTYVLEEEGKVRLPDIEILWWDIEADRLRTEILPGGELEVKLNPELVVEEAVLEEELAEAPPEESSEETPWGRVVGFLVLLALVVAARRPVVRLVTAVAVRLGRGSGGEAAYFRRFRQAARGGDPRSTLAALYAWMDRFAPGSPTTLESFAENAGDSALSEELRGLLEAASTGCGIWSPRSLVRGVAKARFARRRRPSMQPLSRLVSLSPRM